MLFDASQSISNTSMKYFLLVIVLLSRPFAWDGGVYRSIFVEAVDRSPSIIPLQRLGKTAETALLNVHRNRLTLLQNLDSNRLSSQPLGQKIISKIEEILEEFKQTMGKKEEARLFARLGFFVCALSDPSSFSVIQSSDIAKALVKSFDNWANANLNVHKALRERYSTWGLPTRHHCVQLPDHQ